MFFYLDSVYPHSHSNYMAKRPARQAEIRTLDIPIVAGRHINNVAKPHSALARLTLLRYAA